MSRRLLAVLGFAGLFLTSQKSIAEVQYFFSTNGYNPSGPIFSITEFAPGRFKYNYITDVRGFNVELIYHDPVKNKIFSFEKNGFAAKEYDIESDTWSDIKLETGPFFGRMSSPMQSTVYYDKVTSNRVISNTDSIITLNKDIPRLEKDIFANKTVIKSNISATDTNASNISNNTRDIEANASNISINTKGIKANASNISINTKGIKANASNISINTKGIKANASNILINKSDIEANASNILINKSDIEANVTGISENKSQIESNDDDIASLMDKIDNPNKVQVKDNGFSVGGANLIETNDGITSIGQNSIKFQEVDGVEQMWAEDKADNVIDINIAKGSDLLINGRSVQGQIDDNRSAINSNRNNINSLGEGVAASTALSSAMTALPTVSADSQLTCGVGTGTYSGATAVALGCASKINDRLSVNIGGSKVLQGSSSYEYGSGSLDSFAARAGLVMRLGKLHKPNATDEELQARLQQVEAENQEIQQQNKQLMARLERLEAIALGIQPKTDELAVVPAVVIE